MKLAELMCDKDAKCEIAHVQLSNMAENIHRTAKKQTKRSPVKVSLRLEGGGGRDREREISI
jgi:hypothetical protein